MNVETFFVKAIESKPEQTKLIEKSASRVQSGLVVNRGRSIGQQKD